MKKILILGAGMVGTAIAADLSNKFDVTCVDISSQRLNNVASKYGVKVIQQNLEDTDSIKNIFSKCDILVNAVPGFMGYKTLKMAVEAGKDVVDISFFAEDPFTLNELALEKNVAVVVDCGIAPGLSNIIFGYNSLRYKLNSYKCYVGGLPFERKLPFQYKAPFSPTDVIEEYTRPARIREKGSTVIKPALTEPELLNFEKIGTLEAFNSDGLRSLLTTMNTPDMVEKTLRYPGHLAAVKLLNDSGFFSRENISLNGMNIKPVDVTSKILFNLWKLEEDENEFTVLKIILESDDKVITYNLLDTKDIISGFTSMARTTGFTCTAVVNLLSEERIKRKGILPPEYIGMDENNYNYVINYLNERNINLSESIKDRNTD